MSTMTTMSTPSTALIPDSARAPQLAGPGAPEPHRALHRRGSPTRHPNRALFLVLTVMAALILTTGISLQLTAGTSGDPGSSEYDLAGFTD